MLVKMIRVATVLVLTLSVAGAASVSDARTRAVVRQGACSGAAHWKLKLKPDNGRIEVEFEVDQNVAGKVWRVRIVHNGTRILAGRRTTHGPSGSFTVRVLATDAAATDGFVARATALASGQTCVGRASI
jgi:hypothetical protein